MLLFILVEYQNFSELWVGEAEVLLAEISAEVSLGKPLVGAEYVKFVAVFFFLTLRS